MAEVNESTVNPCDYSILYSTSQTVKNCVNCILKEHQLKLALSELKSAQTIISILREDIIRLLHEDGKEHSLTKRSRIPTRLEEREDTWTVING
jgi:GTP1/Obg family GTP-binding protein